MKRHILAFVAVASTAAFLSANKAQAGSYPFGDEPYRLNWGYDPEIESGCWKWNWQQHQWDDHCPRYIQPKAYMYRGSVRTVVRTRG